MKSRNFVTIAAIATALILATTAAVSLTPENVFAYKKSQAASLANACGNGEIPTNVGCQNTDSQIQGDENVVSLAAQQTFPEVELVQEEPPITPPPPPPEEICGDGIDNDGDGMVDEDCPPPTCEECLEPFIGTGFAIILADELGLGSFADDQAAVDAICEALVAGEISIESFETALILLGITAEGRQIILDCLQAALGVI